MDELHDAPILYINVETPPTLSDPDRQKLRAFTDTGGTILFCARRDNRAAHKWFFELAKSVWPEWPLKPFSAKDPAFQDPYALKWPPGCLGIDDGLRTFVFVRDDLPCVWQCRAIQDKWDQFHFAMNLWSGVLQYAPRPTRLPPAPPTEPDRYTTPVKAGDRKSLTVARLKYDDTGWIAGRNYRGLDLVASAVAKRAGVDLNPHVS